MTLLSCSHSPSILFAQGLSPTYACGPLARIICMQHESVDTIFLFIVSLFTNWQFLYMPFRMMNFCCLSLLLAELVYVICCSPAATSQGLTCAVVVSECGSLGLTETPCSPVWFTAKNILYNLFLLCCLFCLAGTHKCTGTHAHHTIAVSFLPIPVTRHYGKTETGKQCPVTSDYYNKGTCLILEKWADPVKFFICEKLTLEYGQNSSGEKIFLFTQGAY